MTQLDVSTGEIVTVEAQAVRSVISPEDMKARYQELEAMVSAVMVKDVDYGVIPGTSGKLTLLKAGAEKLCVFFGLEASFEAMDGSVIDLTSENPIVIARYRCVLRSRMYGYTVGSGIGVCTSKEKKYSNRAPADVLNTVDKMAQKRALVAAVLIAVGASEFFTQDMEDFQPDQPAAPVTPSRWTQDAKSVEKFYLWLNNMGYNPIEVLQALGVQSVYDITAAKQDVIDRITAHFQPIQVDIDQVDEIAYQQAEEAIFGKPIDRRATLEDEASFMLAKEQTPPDHFLSNTQQRKRFFKQIDTLGYTREGIIELMGINRLHELPANYDQAVASIMVEHAKQR